MTVRIRLNVKGFEALLTGGTDTGVTKAANKCRTFARRKAGRPFHKKKRVRVNGKQVTKYLRGDASKPGESPKKRVTGKGQKAIESRKIAKGVARTYVNGRMAPYMKFYETTADVTKRRPFLAPAVTENQKELFKLIVTPVKRRMRRGR